MTKKKQKKQGKKHALQKNPFFYNTSRNKQTNKQTTNRKITQ